GTGQLSAGPPSNPATTAGRKNIRAAVITDARGVIDVTIKDLVLTAATLPAILGQRVRLLHIDESRVAMANVPSMWPAVWVSGIEIHIDRNWVGIQSAANIVEWLPASVAGDLAADANAAGSSTGTLGTAGSSDKFNEAALFVNLPAVRHPGGIQIAGPS